MNEHQATQLESIVTEVMLQMAFMFANRVDEEDFPGDTARLVRTWMDFRGPLRGRLTLIAGEEMCREMAANILGLDADDELARASAIDALKEVLNVLCGHVITALAGDEACFEMIPPTAEALTSGEWSEMEKTPQPLCFCVDDHPMLLQLEMEPS